MKSARLATLLRELTSVNPRPATATAAGEITAIDHDSRRVQRGSLFVCLPGLRRDGHEFGLRAFQAGAVAVVGERETVAGVTPYVRVDDARKALGLLASRWHDHPSRSLRLVGVTGTNGKSSVTWMIEAICEQAGMPAALMGTLGVGRRRDLRPQPFTTPEATEFHAELARLRDAGSRVVAVEVSSHGLELRRTYGTRFEVVVFTNLSQDHLDFHLSMERYAAAKNLLFREQERGPDEPPAHAVVNADDPHLDAILEGTTDQVLRFGMAETADVRAHSVEMDAQGIRLRVAFPGGELPLHSPLLGSFQVENLLAAFATGLVLGVDPERIAAGLATVSGIPGRMERVDAGQSFLVLVDYAHTPDALRRALDSLRPFTSGRIVVVFGCGGERDRSKRYRMGQIASYAADRIILTDDNPRGEDPQKIRDEVSEGLRSTGAEFVEEGDRAEAIARAVETAEADDIVFIAGKGHETVQIRGERVIPFDDRDVAAGKVRERLERDARTEGGT